MPATVSATLQTTPTTLVAEKLPKWLPTPKLHYLQHVYRGVPIREIARRSGHHASTILRQVQKIEACRDDPLLDEALDDIAASYGAFLEDPPNSMEQEMSSVPACALDYDESEVEKEARRILRRLCEAHTFLLVSPEMEKAAVFKEAVPGRRTRIAVVDRAIAQVFALRDWVEGKHSGRVGIYRVTSTGKSALKRLLAEDRKARGPAVGYAGAVTPFQEQHRDMGERNIAEPDGVRKVSYNLAESPLTSLSRKKAPDGSPYLNADQLAAGERLREDFELAQMGPRVAQNWDNFLTASVRGGTTETSGPSDSSARARERVSAALAELGPGLADIAFRCCCFLEGLETAEKRLGWSARAGKVVLRISLQRLAEFYARSGDSRLIG